MYDPDQGGSEMTTTLNATERGVMDALIAWCEANPRSAARIVWADGRRHTGYLTVTRLSDGRVSVSVRNSDRLHGQYRTVSDWMLAGEQLQIKVGARYRPAPEVILAHDVC
jgi:hypothetical protein